MPRDAIRLIVGADSGIGSALLRRLRADGVAAVGTSRRSPSDDALSLDLSADPDSWSLPDSVGVAIVCAAVTSMQRCREDVPNSRLVNVTHTLDLAGRLRRRGAHLVFLSTNQVFDGTVPNASADAPTNPQSEYGRQKAAVERDLLAAGNATIVRFTKVVRTPAPLVRDWATALRMRDSISAFADLRMSPIPLAFAVEVLAHIGRSPCGGIVQASATHDVSYADVADRLAEKLGVPQSLVLRTSCFDHGFPPDAAPRFTTLDASRLVQEYGLAPPPVCETIDALIEGTIHG